jgi:hypothetical protein
MNTQELANAYVALCREGKFTEAGQKFFHDNVISREPMEGEMAIVAGRKAVEGKSAWWAANHEVHGVKVAGPYLHGDQFIVHFTIDVTPKSGKRMTMDEMGLITTKNGKIVEEVFFVPPR